MKNKINPAQKLSRMFNGNMRLYQLLNILEEKEELSVNELGRKLGCSYRTVYRMLKALEEGGVPVVHNHGYPHLIGEQRCEEQESVFFSTEETMMLLEMIQGLSADNPFKQSLSSKLGQDFRSTLMPYFTCDGESIRCVSAINNAMIEHKQLLIKDYASSNSGIVGDRLVEPVKWSANYRQVHAYDIAKRAMRTFVVHRMKGAEATAQKWQYEAEHRAQEEDCFWMTGEEEHNVTLVMNLRALNLLHEEYPLSEQYPVMASGEENLPYRVTLMVRSPWGIDRFVKGLDGNIRYE